MNAAANVFCVPYERDLKMLKDAYTKIKSLETEEIVKDEQYQNRIAHLSDSIKDLEKMIFNFKNTLEE